MFFYFFFPPFSLQFGKGFQEPQAGIAAFLRGGTACRTPCPLRTAPVTGIVLADGQGAVSAVFGVVAVHVVDVLARPGCTWNSGSFPGHDVQRVPADLRHFQALVGQVGIQRADLAGHEAQARVFAVLIAFSNSSCIPRQMPSSSLVAASSF